MISANKSFAAPAARLCLTAGFFFALTFGAAAHQHNPSGHGNGGHNHDIAFGEPGDPAEVDRTVTVVMTDHAYNISQLTVWPGETVRFVLKNEGEFVHEFNLGTPHMHDEHQEEMAKMLERGTMSFTEIDPKGSSGNSHGSGHGHGSDTAHDDPNAVLVEPGDTAELTWTFATSSRLQFACNLPGHYESGMVGEVIFASAN